MHPVIADFHTTALETWNVLAFLGFIAAVILGRGLLLSRRAPLASIAAGIGWGFVAALISGRLVYVLVHASHFASQPAEALAVWRGGLVSWGSLAGGYAGAAWAARSTKQSPRIFLDVAAIAYSLAMVIGRLGCFFAGCDYGEVSSELWWAVTFDDPRSLVPASLLGLPLHPTQIYMALGNFAAFAAGLVVYRHMRRDGAAFGTVAIVFAISRFLVEIYRGDADRGMFWSNTFSYGQVFCLIWLILGVVFIAKSRPRAPLAPRGVGDKPLDA